MDQSPVTLERREAVAKITLNRPEVLNSFDQPMFDRFMVAVQEVMNDRSVRAVLLTGAGRGFCAGQDISQGVPTVPYGEHLERNWNRLARALRNVEVPTVCAVNGVAAGAGANVALACDFVIAANEASFIQSFVNIGLVPDTAGTWILPRLVGRARAAELLMLGDKLSATRAAEWGLIYRAVPLESLENESWALANRLAALPTLALRLTKHLLSASATNSFENQLAAEAERQTIAGQSHDHAEGVAAFRAKRKPNFEGR